MGRRDYSREFKVSAVGLVQQQGYYAWRRRPRIWGSIPLRCAAG